jgi:hypothetical protein
MLSLYLYTACFLLTVFLVRCKSPVLSCIYACIVSIFITLVDPSNNTVQYVQVVSIQMIIIWLSELMWSRISHDWVHHITYSVVLVLFLATSDRNSEWLCFKAAESFLFELAGILDAINKRWRNNILIRTTHFCFFIYRLVWSFHMLFMIRNHDDCKDIRHVLWLPIVGIIMDVRVIILILSRRVIPLYKN